jgi:hypothetical protein
MRSQPQGARAWSSRRPSSRWRSRRRTAGCCVETIQRGIRFQRVGLENGSRSPGIRRHLTASSRVSVGSASARAACSRAGYCSRA